MKKSILITATILIILAIVYIVRTRSVGYRESNKTLEKEQAWVELKQSTDYYDYLLYLNKYPESEKFDSLLYLYRKYQEVLFEENPMPPWSCKNNCIEMSLTESVLEFENSEIKLNQLQDSCYAYLLNIEEKKLLPRKYEVQLNDGRKKLVSKGFFVIYYDNLTSTKQLQNVVVEAKSAIYNYKEKLSYDWFENITRLIHKQEQHFLDSLFQNWIWVFESIGIKPPPPPPPPNYENDK